MNIAAEHLGRGSEEFGMHGKDLELFWADVRRFKVYGLGHAISSRGADHLRSEPWFEFAGQRTVDALQINLGRRSCLNWKLKSG
ncbi:MAG: hypothetical protein A2Z14_01965 [Chloroflexi bacterium RBG_16_48_8]|nr:MAG: hypothetical protein A2Z14_01965 [Chloroflexi bacterium RBG_16_48_8]